MPNKPIANIILNREKLKAFSLKSGIGRDFLNRTPIAQKIIAGVDK
jgi:hypothetical protein